MLKRNSQPKIEKNIYEFYSRLNWFLKQASIHKYLMIILRSTYDKIKEKNLDTEKATLAKE
jgi:hypothetical protein